LPVFPEGSAALEGGVLSFQGSTYQEGDTVEFLGGNADAAEIEGVYVPPACDDTKLFVVADIAD
jgi:hypothetical protein